MSQVERLGAVGYDDRAGSAGIEWLHRGVARAIMLAAVAIAAVTLVIVLGTASAWRLLGVGRGLVPEALYPLSGFLIILATTYGQAVGWAAGSFLLAYAVGVLTGRPVTSRGARAAMIVVYVGLAAVPLAAYHVLFGPPLLGLEREGLAEWLRAGHPGAYVLLYWLHPLVDLSLVPLGIAVIWILWWTSDAALSSPRLQLILALCVLATSLAVALSLGIHSIFAHIRL